MRNYFLSMIMALTMILMASLPANSQDIYSAVAGGDVQKTREYLEKDPDLLNRRNADLLTPLNLAAERGQTEVAEFLLEMGADPLAGDNENSQPIHLAAVNGHIPVLDLLLDHGVDINARDDNQMTPLLFAVSRGQVEMSKHLIDKGADMKLTTTTGVNAFQMAAIGGNLELVMFFADNGFPINSKTPRGFTALHSAASYGRTEVVKYLVEKGARIDEENEEGTQPLAMAVGRNSYDAALFLIDEGADVTHRDKQGFAAIHEAAGRGNISVVQLLLDHGVDVNAATNAGWVPMTSAAWAPNAAEMARFLIQHGADVNPDPCRDVKICTCGPNFFTPLHNACQMAKLELVKILVDNGAKVNLFNSEGLPPMYYAIRSGDREMVAYLLDHGAFLNVKESRLGTTELHMAAALGYEDISALLIERGSSLEIKDNEGKTPLDYALYYGQEKIGYEMLAAGASDSSLVAYFNEECLLSKKIGNGEAEAWFLGNSGWAVRTQNHFLVFDYFDNTRAKQPEHPCLSSGFINPSELAGQKMFVFSTHSHQDHYNRSIFNWDDNNPDVNYILCHKPADADNEYAYIPVHGTAEVGGMDIYVIKSTDSGGGFLVEVDGLVIFHMGDHSNGDDELSADFTSEIDLVAQQNKNIDILFGPIRGCSLGTPEQVKAGTYYTLEKLHPALFVPMHSGDYRYEYRDFAEQAQRDGLTQPMKCVFAKGDRFHYSRGEETVAR
jgi:ankyrin repeat protein/L-ascorbate metabolism protein UlaG (beta-lactamase superfamily)